MASTADFRNGMTLAYNNDLYVIVEFQHVKPGKGGAFVRTKLKSVTNGRVIDPTFRAGEKVEEVRLERRFMQYLYRDAHHFTFMDTASYEQIQLDEKAVEDVMDLMKENVEVSILFNGEVALGVELPASVELMITDTQPNDKGDTASGGKKPATLETGAVVNVPFFVDRGEVIRVDTRKREYLERVKK
ncbi:MAG: elongation factor P [Calditrichaeota bacterium]|nr:elongation factor P [Candidatus Cloacimonadota bacterium]MCB1047905.1 elongation factor P [Calditrichota bacterium]MCB9474762.1 elongation factor P [Candidatus Delongbacteria bacterium]